MKQYIKAFRYLAGTVALSMAFALVCFAQQAAGARLAQAQTAAPKEVPADRIAGMVAEWTRARDYTKEYLDVMPEDGLALKPNPDIRSFSEQMLHLTAGFYFFAKPVFGVDAPVADVRGFEKVEKLNKSKADLTKAVMEGYDFVLAQIKTMTPAKLDETVTVFGTKMPRHVAIAKAFEHQTHHRGQTTIYIRLKGIKPPNERLF
ncbi:MAG: DinB family protein [Blastocatellia bacterium]